jgi:6-pyruvoyl-tetrahydropterin synthase
MEQILAPIRGTHLNEKLAISPTSENLALWLWDELSSVLPDAPMHSITVDLCNLDGDSMGSARVFA